MQPVHAYSFLAAQDGLSLAARVHLGAWTIGIGHRLTADELSSEILTDFPEVRWTDGITQPQAYALLARDLLAATAAVSRSLHATPTQYQFDALVCFAHAVSPAAYVVSPIARLMNTGRVGEVPEAMRRHNRIARRFSRVLDTRRRAEGDLFMKG